MELPKSDVVRSNVSCTTRLVSMMTSISLVFLKLDVAWQ